jgi:hypothetical protein
VAVAAYAHKNFKKSLKHVSKFISYTYVIENTISITKPNRLMLFRDMCIRCYCEHNAKYINTFSEQHAVCTVKAGRTLTASAML